MIKSKRSKDSKKENNSDEEKQIEFTLTEKVDVKKVLELFTVKEIDLTGVEIATLI